jgi:hypothetical protein
MAGAVPAPVTPPVSPAACQSRSSLPRAVYKTCTRHAQDMLKTCSRHAQDPASGACLEHVLSMSCTRREGEVGEARKAVETTWRLPSDYLEMAFRLRTHPCGVRVCVRSPQPVAAMKGRSQSTRYRSIRQRTERPRTASRRQRSGQAEFLLIPLAGDQAGAVG